MNGAEHAEEHFLGEIQRLVAVAEEVHREMDHHPLVFGHQVGAGRFFPDGTPLDERGLATVDVRQAGNARLFHREFHYTKLDPANTRKFLDIFYSRSLAN